MTKHLLSKSTFIRGTQCKKSLYLHYKRPFLRDKLSAEQLFKFKRGTDVGVLARDLFPGGIDMTPRSPTQYQKKRDETAEALGNPNIEIIYEAVFQYDDVLIMLDILVRDGNKWKAYEVKSSRAISTTFLKDAALQFYVMQGCNVQMSDFSLIYINKDYVLDTTLSLNKLFIIQSVHDQVTLQLEPIAHEISAMKQLLLRDHSPEIEIGMQCKIPYPCDFIGHCWKNIPENSILHLRTFEQSLLFENYFQGMDLLQQFESRESNNIIQKLEIESFKKQTLIYNIDAIKRIFKEFDALEGNGIIYLKLLIEQPAVPLVRKTKPYQRIPIAMSILFNNEILAQNRQFSADEAGVLSFIATIKDLMSLNKLIVVDDSFEIIECLKNLVDKFIDKSDCLPENWSHYFLGIRQLVNQGLVFHPKLGEEWKLPVLLAIVSENKKQLIDELSLTNELSKANKRVEMPLEVDHKISHYSFTLRYLFRFFCELK